MSALYVFVGMLCALLIVGRLGRVALSLRVALRRRHLNKFWAEFFAAQDAQWTERHG